MKPDDKIVSTPCFEAFARSAQDAIIIVNDKAKIVFWNNGAENILGFKYEDVIGQNMEFLVPKRFLKLHHKRFFSAVKVRKTNLLPAIEVLILTKTGEELITEFTLSSWVEGHKMYFTAIVRDVTDRKRAERQLKNTEAKMVENAKLATLGEMAGSIAHEINNPLSIITNIIPKQIKALNDPRVPEDIRKDMIKRIKMNDTAVKRMIKIIRGLKTFARDGSKDPLEMIKVNDLFEDTLEFCKTKLINSNIKLDLICQEDLVVNCRPTQLSQVILNLLHNSRDAIENLDDKWIKIETKCNSGENTFITITDSGNGIPIEIQSKMLQPFFTTKEFGKGTGLGLSISKGIVEDHGGKFYIDNDCPNTKFVIELPGCYCEMKNKEAA